MTDKDAEQDVALLEELRDMWVTYDPPPPGLTAAMIAIVAAADLDEEWELLTLVSDSARRAGRAGPRPQHRPGALLQRRGGLVARGRDRRRPGHAASCSTTPATWGPSRSRWRPARGSPGRPGLDEVGFFALQAEATGSVRFAVTIDGRVARSRWLDV